MNKQNIPPILGVLETAVYVDNMEKARGFYRDILGLAEKSANARMAVYDAGSGGVLLVFQRGKTDDSQIPGGLVPGHTSHGNAHFAFSVDREQIDHWRSYLTACNVEIISEVSWPRGGLSLYFNDPDGNVLELAPKEIWGLGR